MLNRTVAPAFNRSTDFALLTPEHIILSNGLPVYLISGGQQEVLRLELVIRAGRWYESKWGVSHFTGNLLTKGTSKHSSFDIAQTFDRYGAHIDVSAGLDHITVSLLTLNRHLKPTLTLLLELLTDAVFPEKELEQSKAIYLQSLKVNQEKTSFLAAKQFRKNIFGEQHPYGRELEAQDVSDVAANDLRQYFRQQLGDALLMVAGKIGDAERHLIQETFGQLPYARQTPRTLAPASPSTGRLTFEKEGSVQSSLRLGKPFVAQTHPDFYDILLFNHILGGYFGSRLMKNIREEKGLTYGIYSAMHHLQHGNYLVIGADVNKENVSLAFDEIRKEIEQLAVTPLEESEFETARNHFIGSLQSEITTPFAHAEKIKNSLLFQLPTDFYQKLIARMDHMTPDDLLRVGRTYFDASSLLEVAVG